MSETVSSVQAHIFSYNSAHSTNFSAIFLQYIHMGQHIMYTKGYCYMSISLEIIGL